MDETKQETVVQTGRRVKSTILPIGLCVCSLVLYFLPYTVSLCLQHTHYESAFAQPASISTPEWTLYQIFSSPVICFLLLTGFARYISVKTVCQLQSLSVWVRLANVFATFALVLSTFGFFLNTNLTNQSFHGANYVISYITSTGFVVHFALQIPISFKLIGVQGSENVIGLRILIIFLQIVCWLVECLAKQLCAKQLHGMLHCEEYLNTSSAVMLSWIIPMTTTFQFMLYYWDFKSVWIDTHVYVKHEKKQYKENQTKQIVIYNSPNYSSLKWIPFSLVTFLVCSVIVPMAILVYNQAKKELLQFPSISPDGPDSPQADVYTCLTTVSAYLGYAFVMVLYNAMNNLLAKDPHQYPTIFTINTIAAFSGILMFLGLNVAGIILLGRTMHMIGTGFFFLNGLFYMTMMVGISYVAGEEKNNIIKVMRILLVGTAWICLIVVIVLMILKTEHSQKIVAFESLGNDELLTFIVHIFEWFMMLCIVPFISTFSPDFKSAYFNLTPSINNTILDDRYAYKMEKVGAADEDAEVTSV